MDRHTDRPHPARDYDYLLGGKDDFAADRIAAEQGLKAKPDVERFFDGLELVEPGVRVLPAWRPDNGGEAPTDAQVSVYGGVARKA